VKKSILFIAAVCLSVCACSCMSTPNTGEGELAAKSGALKPRNVYSQTPSEFEFYLLNETGTGDALKMYIQNVVLPSQMSAFAWNRFSLAKAGISLEADTDLTGFVVLENTKIDAANGVTFYKVRAYKTPLGNEGTRMTVAFSASELYDEAKEVRYHPETFAILRGARGSNLPKGEIRLLAVRYLKDGKFQADVLIR